MVAGIGSHLVFGEQQQQVGGVPSSYVTSFGQVGQVGAGKRKKRRKKTNRKKKIHEKDEKER